MGAAEVMKPWQQPQQDTFSGNSRSDWTGQGTSKPFCVHQTATLQQWLPGPAGGKQHGEQLDSQHGLHGQCQQQWQIWEQQQHDADHHHHQQMSSLGEMYTHYGPTAATQLQHPSPQLLWHSKPADFQSSQSLRYHLRSVCIPISAAAAAGPGAIPARATPTAAVTAGAAAGGTSHKPPANDSATTPAVAAASAGAAGCAGSCSTLNPAHSDKTSSSDKCTFGAASDVLQALRTQCIQAVHEASVAAAAANAANDAAKSAHAAASAAKALYAEAVAAAGGAAKQKAPSDDTPASVAQQRMRDGSDAASPGSTNKAHQCSSSLQQLTSSPSSSIANSAPDCHTARIGTAKMQQNGSTAATAATAAAVPEAVAQVPQLAAGPICVNVPAAEAHVNTAWHNQVLLSPLYKQPLPAEHRKQYQQQHQLQQCDVQIVKGGLSQPEAQQQALSDCQLAALDDFAAGVPDTAGDLFEAISMISSRAASPQVDPNAAAAAAVHAQTDGGGRPTAAAAGGAATTADVLNTVQQSHPAAEVDCMWRSSYASVGGYADELTAGAEANMMLQAKPLVAGAAAAADAAWMPVGAVDYGVASGNEAQPMAQVLLGDAASDDLAVPSKRRKISTEAAAANAAAVPHGHRRQPALAAVLADLAGIDQSLGTHDVDTACRDIEMYFPEEEEEAVVDRAASVASAAATADQLHAPPAVPAAQTADASHQLHLQHNCDPFNGIAPISLLPCDGNSPSAASDQQWYYHPKQHQRQLQHGLKAGYESVTHSYRGSMLPLSATGSVTAVYPNAAGMHGTCSSNNPYLPGAAADGSAAASNPGRGSSLQLWPSGRSLDSCAAAAMAAGQVMPSSLDSSYQMTTVTSGHGNVSALPCSAYGISTEAGRVLTSVAGGMVAAHRDLPPVPLGPAKAAIGLSRTVTSGQADLASTIAAATAQDQSSNGSPSPLAIAAKLTPHDQPKAPATLTTARLQQVLRRFRADGK